ncbi:MAG: hypothetical protein JO357_16620 [Hyphomicrobiales bacterium]|nr:hypothetical protein [Hyphomicrobiales bacterium]
MSDTDRSGTAPEASAAKSKPGRRRAGSAGDAASGRGENSLASSVTESAPAELGSTDPEATGAMPASSSKGEELPANPLGSKPDQPKREAAAEATAEVAPEATTPLKDREDAAAAASSSTPPQDNLTPSEPAAPSPWRHLGEEPPPRSPSPEPRSARVLASVALALSIILPAALYAYLALSGVLDHGPERLGRLEREVDALKTSSATKPEVTRADLDKLAARLEALEKAVPAQGQRPAAAGSLDNLTARIDAASRDARDALSAARSAAETASGVQSSATRLTNVESKLVALQKELATLEQSVTARPKQDVNAPSILVMSRAIEADLNRDVAYGGELDALSRLGADPKLVETLRPFAEKGAPSSASLASDFENELEAAREKVAETSQPANWWNRAVGIVGRIVRVRHIGADEPGSPAGAVEEALLRGDIEAAREAWEALPVFEKNATPHSGARIKELADAYKAARQISSDALDAIRRSSSTDSGG